MTDNNRYPEPWPDNEAVRATWPERVIELGRAWHGLEQPTRRDRVLSELWLLLNAAIARYLRFHSRRYGYGSLEDLQDIASEKSLELLRRIDSRMWDPAEASPGQLCSFISTLARNGLIDHMRVIGSKRVDEVEAAERGRILPGTSLRPRDERTDAGSDRDQFIGAIRDCAHLLKPRTRTIWFLRVLLEMPSKDIAHHPEVNMKSSAVDMTLSRCRTVIRQCMEEKGFGADDIPPGTLAALWEQFRHEVDTE
ncbi:MAG: sigma-70 family RNA polymerase sigma factor [Candidatus Krumholzibacteriota bacterium]|nr:sigma-70 family RNA polymerase sigma factor [Candidatus Krumholzibacteriota bacterium]